VAGLSVGATVVVQVGVLAAVPADSRVVVSLIMLTAWTAGLWLVALKVSRRPAPIRGRAGPATKGTGQTLSPQMQAAWRLARLGATADQVAEAAGLPLALAELLVADAERAADAPGDTPPGQEPRHG
jgi:hypothetical protein